MIPPVTSSPGPRRPVFVAFILALLAWFLPLAHGAKITWDPVPPEDLAAKDCRYYPGASAEMLFVRQTLDASGDDEWADHYRRIKIYSFKGAEQLGVMNIEYPSSQRIWNLAARVIKPDGAMAEYDKKNFTEAVAAKLKGSKWNRSTLAIPALEAGDILELKWSSSIESEAYLYSWWYSMLNLPVRHYNFKVKSAAHDFRLMWFNGGNEPDKAAKKGEIQLNQRFILPFEEEPFMAPERDVRSWFLLLYTDRALRWYSKDDVWKAVSNYHEEDFRLGTKPDAAVKAKAAELLQGASTDEEKLRRLYEYCQHTISNLDYFDSAELQKAKKRLEAGKEQSPSATLKQGSGYSSHVNRLFGALARAAGYDVALARSASRYVTLNVKNPDGWLFIPDDLICVRVGDSWRKYAPGDYYVPAGMLDPSNELAPSLVCIEDKVVFDDNQASLADKSVVNRKGRFVLDAEGNLEGEVEITKTGHPAIKDRKGWHSEQQAEIDKGYIEKISQRLPAAEVTDLTWQDLRDNRSPVVARYKVKVPAYADVVGSKIILPVNVFQRNAPAVFTSENRTSPIYFDYAWKENDDVQIVLPEGFVLDAPSAPRNVGAVTEPVGVTYRTTYHGPTRTLTCRRNFAVGGNGVTAFQAKSYRVLKRLFDSIKRSDEHTLVLSHPEAPAEPAPATAATN